jgi:hypothetical protein
MPTRYIKESCRTSKNLQALSDFSERLFWRLLTTADDYGRCLACPEIIRAHCFPLNNKLSISHIKKALSDLQTNHLISVYIVGDRHYAEFVTFSLHQGPPRAKASKYPDKSTSANICPQMPAIAPDLGDGPDTDTDTNTDTDLNSLSSLSSSESEFEQFWACYPVKVGKKDAKKAWRKAEDLPPLFDILKAIDNAKNSHQWLKENGQFIPNPSTWLNQGRWADEPTKKPISTLEAFLDRKDHDDTHRIC